MTECDTDPWTQEQDSGTHPCRDRTGLLEMGRGRDKEQRHKIRDREPHLPSLRKETVSLTLVLFLLLWNGKVWEATISSSVVTLSPENIFMIFNLIIVFHPIRTVPSLIVLMYSA